MENSEQQGENGEEETERNGEAKSVRNGKQDTERHEVDSLKVEKAADYLLYYHNAYVKKLERVYLLLDLWMVPTETQVIYIPLPHKFQLQPSNFCLFTKMEPDMSIQQTQMFYQELLSQRGVSQEIEIVPLEIPTKHRTEKHRGFRRHITFADAKIRSLVQSHFGENFCDRYVKFLDLESGGLAAELNLHIQSTRLNIYRGRRCGITVGDTWMELEHVVENVLAAAQVLAEKLPMKWKNVRALSLKPQSVIELPIYSSPIGRLKELGLEEEIDKIRKKNKRKKKKGVNSANGSKAVTTGAEEAEDQPAEEEEKAEDQPAEEAEDQPAEEEDTTAPHKEPEHADMDLDTATPQNEPDKEKDLDATSPHKEEKETDNGEMGILQPLPSSAKKKKRDETGPEKISEENVQDISTKRPRRSTRFVDAKE